MHVVKSSGFSKGIQNYMSLCVCGGREKTKKRIGSGHRSIQRIEKDICGIKLDTQHKHKLLHTCLCNVHV